MWDEIETAIRERRVPIAKRLIAAELKRARGAAGTLFRACEGYRRLGLYLEGLRALDLDERGYRRTFSTDSTEGRKLLWAARFLNLLGAPTHSRALADQIEPQGYEDHKILGSLALSYYEPQRAITHLERARTLEPEPGSYASRIVELTYASALADVGRMDGALTLVDSVAERSPEPLLRAIAEQGRGEYLARAGDLPAALRVLERAHERFPPGDTSPDYAILRKWLGYARLRLAQGESDRVRARADFDRALELLTLPSIRPEGWLDVLRLREEAEGARPASGAIPGPDSARWLALQCYPLCPTGYIDELGRPAEATWGASWATPSLHIDLASVECRDSGPKGDPGSRSLGVSRERHLLALARLAWPWPLNPMTAQALLWPDEACSFPQLAERLKKLMARVRAETDGRSKPKSAEPALRMEQGWICLSDAAARAIQVTVSNRLLPPSMLTDGRTEFLPGEVDAYYGVSHSQRALILKGWVERGWVDAQGKGRAIRYSVAGKS